MWSPADSQQQNQDLNPTIEMNEFYHNHMSLKKNPKLQMKTQPNTLTLVSQDPEQKTQMPWLNFWPTELWTNKWVFF